MLLLVLNWQEIGKNNYKILRNAINIAKFEYNNEARVLIRNEFGIKEEDFVVGHIGKFMDAKNHEFLIKVFAEYHLKHSNSKLLLVGDGEWRSKVESWVADSGCADSIILAGLRSCNCSSHGYFCISFYI